MKISPQRSKLYLLLLLIGIVILGFWSPRALIFGLQRGSLYALIALPLALVLGIMDILNLSHGELLTVGLYLGYVLAINLGLDPLSSIIPVFVALAIFGGVIYMIAIKRVLGGGHLNQLLLTFGISIVLIESVNIIWTSRPRNIHVDYAGQSVEIMGITTGSYEFLYIFAAVAVFLLLRLFLKKTKLGQAVFAVGQNPKGAKIVGINVDFVYLFVFALASGLMGLTASIMLPRVSIFPETGNPFALISFSLVAMAGMGSINGILFAGISLGLAEAAVNSIPGYGGWSDIVFFGVLIIVIMAKNL